MSKVMPKPAASPAVSRGTRAASSRISFMDGLLAVLAVLATVVFMLPLYWAISTSLRSPMETFTVSGLGIPFVHFKPTLVNWIEQLAVGETQRALVNSLVIAVCSSILALVLGIPAAYALARFRFTRPQNKDITVWFLSQRVLPPVVTVIPFFLMMRSLGLLDTRLALILANTTFILPFVVIIVRQAFLDLPTEMEEAAWVDGAGVGKTLWYVALPLVAPAITATALIIFAFAWNEFLFALTIGSRKAMTIPVHMAGAVDTRGVQFWFMAVRALVAMVPPTALAMLAQRYIVQGLTLGAVKG